MHEDRLAGKITGKTLELPAYPIQARLSTIGEEERLSLPDVGEY